MTRFRIVTVLVGLLVTLGGAKIIRAQQCDGGCNFGQFYGCWSYSYSCSAGDSCEGDFCNDVSCSGFNHFFFCVSPQSMCHFPSCTWDVQQCCTTP